MNTHDDTQQVEIPATEDGTEDLSFDEQAFVRSAQARSTRRTVVLVTSIVLGTLALLIGVWMAWNMSIQAQSNRISTYQYELVALSRPNTFISGTGRTDTQFPGARNSYPIYRPVGSRPMPRGTMTIDFDVWGGEVVEADGDSLMWQAPNREFSSAAMAPALLFLRPLDMSGAKSRSGSAADSAVEARQFANWTRLAKQRLDSAPASATAELALSFRTTKSLNEVEALLPDGIELNWGAVDVWSLGQGPSTTMEGSMVGIAFIGPDGAVGPVSRPQLEKDLVDDLHFVAENAPKGTADRCISSADHIEKNGVSYYGVVVTGPVSEMRGLLDSAEVSGATLGFIVEPWE